jgi:hypothetical protein
MYLAILCALPAALGGTPSGKAEPTRDFSRYQIILDRAPFGQMGASDKDAPQPPFSTRFAFVGITSIDDEPPLAVIEEKDNKRVNFKAEGESIGNVKVVKIEKSENGPTKLVLKQDLEVATLMLEAKPGVGAAPAPGGSPPPGPAAQPGQPPGPMPFQPGIRRIPFRRGG